MTREMAKQNLILIGIAEPTAEQITNYLNQLNGETQKATDLAEKYKADSVKMRELQSQLDEINNKNLSEIDLAKKETEKANDKIADLEKTIANMTRKAALAEQGIVGEQADKLFGADGSLDISVLGQIISDRETSAKAAKEKELLENTPNPNGSGAPEGDLNDDLIKSIAKDLSSASTESNLLAQYE